MSLLDANTPDPAALQGSARLTDWGVIRAKGDDAAGFLHNQLTQDTQGLGSDQARLAGYCSAKGRLLASFIVWRPAPDELLLACSADVLPAVLKRLSMFVLRAKCKLSDASAEIALHGLAGEAAAQALGADLPTAAWQRRDHGALQLIRLPDAAPGAPRWLCAGPASEPTPAVAELPLAAWHWLEATSAVPRIVAATVEQFVPQMTNLELVGGVNFQKGCYPGQEIVARSQYRGTLKRRAAVFEAGASAIPGQEVFAEADPSQPAGMVVNAGDWQGSHRALVSLKLDALSAGGLRLGDANGPALQPIALPYEMPTAA